MATTTPSPRAAHGLRLAFYGDDFTGSTDALEVLAFAGLRCALFLDVPDAATLAAFGPFDAIGVAGDSRAMSPAEMDTQLPPLLQRLAALPTPLVHYKVCSTFDSSPAIGSIGRVMDLARTSFGNAPIPIVAATPALGRYCTFGHLFARSGTDGQVHRIDRHPIMRVHPVTPMHESDLALHLGAQTGQRIAKLTLPAFGLGREGFDAEVERAFANAPGAVLFDGTTAEHLTEVGRVLAGLGAVDETNGRPRFAVGSSGLEYALTQWWKASGTLPAGTSAARDYAHFDAVPQVLAVSGSASPLSALQIDAALQATTWADVANGVTKVLDPLCIATVDINPESRVKVDEGPAAKELVEQGWRVFLVKVHNQAGATAELNCSCPNAASIHDSSNDAEPKQPITAADVRERWLQGLVLAFAVPTVFLFLRRVVPGDPKREAARRAAPADA